MQEYCLTVTYKCNWFCDYCIVHTHEQEEPTFQSIKDNIKLIKPGSNVAVTGGEPGLASREVIKYVINELLKKDCITNVNTNGLFFKTYKEFDYLIDCYFYHCSEDLLDYVPIIDCDNVEYMIVITDNNVHNLESFLELNKHIETFSMYGADKTSFQGKEYASLSKGNGIKVFMKHKDRLSDESLEFLLSDNSIVNKKLIRLY